MGPPPLVVDLLEVPSLTDGHLEQEQAFSVMPVTNQAATSELLQAGGAAMSFHLAGEARVAVANTEGSTWEP